MTKIENAWKQASAIIAARIGAGASEYVATKSAVQYVRHHHREVFDRVTDLVAETRYQRRKYGTRTFTWPIPPADFGIGAMDPWPGTSYPRAVLFCDILQHLVTGQKKMVPSLGQFSEVSEKST